MRICKKCGDAIPNKAWIDGKRRVINKRKYCLKCSPFGKHNTKQLHISKEVGDKKCICSVCRREYIYSRKKANSTIRCNSCYVRERRQRIKAEAIKLKGGKCKICGYNKCIASMDFHHLDRTKKEFSISGNNISKAKLFKELEKCILVCKNCHGEIETGIIKFGGEEEQQTRHTVTVEIAGSAPVTPAILTDSLHNGSASGFGPDSEGSIPSESANL